MDFFQAQDNARRKTWQLAALFIAAVITLVVLTNVLLAVFLNWSSAGAMGEDWFSQVPADTWLWTSAAVVGVIAVASAYKYLTLQGGGRTIAESLGGSLIHQSTTNPQQRQLLNIVEEMAIASGIPVPPVYLIPESSINAFAAGFNADDAVVGINQGTLDHLNRAELQGVVAHEFSHILNGDTHINLRLIAILHGILFIGIIGYILLRGGAFSRRNGAPILVLGIGLVALGYGGTFFGNLIKAGVSRQREYLADASAVQFTRDPNGIADALKKIGGLTNHSYMENKVANEASHMFFGSIGSSLRGLFATHPPLDKRIRAIQPNWQGSMTAATGTAQVSNEATMGFANDQPQVTTRAEQISAHVGAPTMDSLTVAREVLAATPDDLKQAAHDPFEARALVYAMLLDSDAKVRDRQLAFLQQQAEPGVPEHVERLAPAVAECDGLRHITLLEMASPTLKELSKRQYQRFSRNAAELITADGHVDIMEWVLHRLLVKELHAHFEGPQKHHGRVSHVRKLDDDAAKLLSILASHTHDSLEQQMAAYQAGADSIGIKQAFSKQNQFDYQRINESLGKLRKLKPLAKPELIKACAATVLADDHVTVTEGALLQGIAATLDCPLPPDIYR